MVNPFVVFELRACIKDVEYSLSTELAGFKLRKKKQTKRSSNWLCDVF